MLASLLISPLTKYGLIIAFITSIFGYGFYKGYEHAKEANEEAVKDAQLQAAIEYSKKVKLYAQTSVDVAASKEKIKTVYKTIVQRVDNVIKQPVYTDCKLDVDGFKLFNDANRGIESTPHTLRLDTTLSTTTNAQ